MVTRAAKGLENSRSTLMTGMPASIALIATSVRAAPSLGSRTMASTPSLMNVSTWLICRFTSLVPSATISSTSEYFFASAWVALVIAPIQPWSAAGAENPIVTVLPGSSFLPATTWVAVSVFFSASGVLPVQAIRAIELNNKYKDDDSKSFGKDFGNAFKDNFSKVLFWLLPFFALVLKLLLGWPIIVGIVVAAFIVAAYISLGGLSSAIYNEVLQFFVIVAALLPLTIVGLVDVGGWNGLKDKIRESDIGEAGLHALQGTAPGDVTNPIGATWVGIVFGLGFVLAFGYWTTNFAEVQRALSAKDLSSAQRTPLIGAVPKLFLPFIMILPGIIALAVIPGLGGSDPNMEYNNAIPLLIDKYLPNGMLGIALTGLMASFMAGVAANVSAFNTVVTTDLVEPYIRKGESDEWYVRFGRIATVVGIGIGIGTALIASLYDNLMNYLQALFSIFNAPLFATFIIGMFWKRMSPLAGFWSLLAGTVVALGTYLLYLADVLKFNSDLSESFWGAGLAFVTVAIVAIVVTPATRPRPDEDLQGLVYGTADVGELDAADRVWWRNPVLLGLVAVVLSFLFYIPVW